MNLADQVAACKNLLEIWRFYFTDLKFQWEPDNRQLQTWLHLYGAEAAETGLTAANTWVNKVAKNRRLCADDVVRYASGCMKQAKAQAVPNGSR